MVEDAEEDQADGHELDRNGEPSEDPWPCLFLVLTCTAVFAVLIMVLVANLLAGT